jgi:hypothetical protein
VVRGPWPEAPSPNDHAHDVTDPWGVLDPEPSKVTLSGAVPVDGVADMTALTTPETRQHVIRAS